MSSPPREVESRDMLNKYCRRVRSFVYPTSIDECKVHVREGDMYRVTWNNDFFILESAGGNVVDARQTATHPLEEYTSLLEAVCVGDICYGCTRRNEDTVFPLDTSRHGKLCSIAKQVAGQWVTGELELLGRSHPGPFPIRPEIPGVD